MKKIVLSIISILSLLFLVECPTVSHPITETKEQPTPVPSETVAPRQPDVLTINGDYLFIEDFENNNRTWEEADTRDLYEKVEKGAYTVHFLNTTGIVYSSVPAHVPTGNFVILADFEKCDGKSGHAYGLTWGMKDTDNCFMIVLSDTGFYTYGTTRKGAFEPLKDWSRSQSLNSGNSKNSIGIKRRGKSYELFFNKRYECDVPYGEPYGDRIGVIVYPTICVTVGSISMFSYTTGESLAKKQSPDESYESGDFDSLDIKGVAELKYLFDYQSLALRVSAQALWLLDTNENRRALELFVHGIPLAKKIDPLDPDILSFMLRKTGTIQYDLGDHQQSLATLTEAFSLCRLNPDIPQCSGIAALIGKIHEDAFRIDDAVVYYTEAVTYAEKDKDQIQKALCLRSLGRCYLSLRSFDKSADSYKSALDIDEGRNDKAHMFEDSIGSAHALESEGLFEESLAYYKKAFSYSKETKNDTWIQESAFKTATIEKFLEHFIESIEDFETARKFAVSCKDFDVALACMSTTADVLVEIGEYKQAIKAYESCIAFALQNGKTEFTFDLRNKLSLSYANTGDYEKAFSLLRESGTDATRPNNPTRTATVHHNSGIVRLAQGSLDQAISEYLEAARTYEEEKNFASLAKEYGFIAHAFSTEGQVDAAFEYAAKSIETAKLSNRQTELADVYLDSGSLYHEWNKDKEAIDCYLKSLDIVKNKGLKEKEARLLINLSIAFDSLDSNPMAQNYCDNALSVASITNKERLIGDTLEYAAGFYDNNGETKKSFDFASGALDLYEKSGINNGAINALETIALLLVRQKNYKGAQDRLVQALALAQKTGNIFETARITGIIGDIALSLGNYKKAIDDYIQSISIIEKLLQNVNPYERNNCIELEITRYRSLGDAYVLGSNPLLAFDAGDKAARLYCAKTLLVRADTEIPLNIGFESLRKSLPADTAVIAFTIADTDDLHILCGTDKGIKIDTAKISIFTSKIVAQYSKLLEMTSDLQPETRDYENRFLMARETDSKKKDFISIIKAYISFLGSPPGDKALADMGEAISRELYDLIISPVRASIQGKSKLLVFPDYTIGFFPLETLLNEKGDYLVSEYSVTYAHSSGVSALVEKRSYHSDRKSLLGFYVPGGMNTGSAPQKTIIKTPGPLFFGLDSVYTDLSVLYSYFGLKREMLSDTAFEYPIPAFVRLGSIFPDGDFHTGKDGSEDALKKLSSDGKLAGYSRVHFEGSMRVVPSVPELSYVSLFRSTVVMNEDGYLRPPEISRLRLQADIVSIVSTDLDLRETGTGDAFASIVESFLVSGANGVLVPFLHVNEKSGNDFISRVYTTAMEKNLSYSDTLAIVKRELINSGTPHPFYWANFVYFGR